MQYPSNVRVLKFPCTGRIDPVFILRAFQKGADGVLVSGCHPGDCHYMAGNFHARRRFAAFRKLLEFVGVDLDRLQFSWVSAAEGGKWVEVVTEPDRKGPGHGTDDRVQGTGAGGAVVRRRSTPRNCKKRTSNLTSQDVTRTILSIVDR